MVIPFTSTKNENDGMTTNKATRKSCGYVDGANRLHHEKMLAKGIFEHPGGEDKKKKVPDFSRTFLGWWSQQDSNL